MITKINELKQLTNNDSIKAICESTIAALSSAIYNKVTPIAQFEIETAAIENLFESLKSHLSDESVANWYNREKRFHTIKNLGIRKGIQALKEEAVINPTLDEVLEKYNDLLNNGASEISLYESFIPAMLNFNYIPAVTQTIDYINNSVKKYNIDIEISKVLEYMKNSKSNYLLPLIENSVNSYLNNKNKQNKYLLKETLIKFSYDECVRNLINLIDVDAVDLQLEYANATTDIEKVFSPIQVISESEALFNIKGTYYIRKGNNINKVNKDSISSIVSKEFIELCEAVNHPSVVLKKDKIEIYHNTDTAIITESDIIINETKYSKDSFTKSNEWSKWAGNGEFFYLVETLRDNFDEIAEIDFAKRVALKEDFSYSADVFKLRDNIFITTHNPHMGKSTFYRNINPIQAQNIMMEHLRFDVSKAFLDVLPDQDRIINEINETKKEYNNYILELQGKIEEYSLISSNPVNAQILEALKEELNEVKTEYTDYLNGIEEFTRPISEAITITVDVDGEKYQVPIPQKGADSTATTGDVKGEESKLDNEPASEISFNDEESELLGDSPSIQADEVDLGADEVETAAKQAELEKEEEPEEEKEEGKEEVKTDDLGLDDLESESGEEESKPEDEEKKEDEEDKKEEDKKKNESLTKKSFVKENTIRKIYLKKSK